MPWQGHTALYALPEIYAAIKAHKTTLLFVNTRWQAELLFQELWRINDDSLADRAASRLARPRRSGARSRRRWRRESSAPSSPPRRSISASTGATSTSSSMSARRRARAGSRSGSAAPTTAWTSRRRASSCRRTASRCWNAAPRSTPTISATRTRRRFAPGALDVLCQHILGMAVAEPFDAVALYDEITSAESYRDLSWENFERAVDFVATGGYALRTYERYAKIRRRKDGPQKGLWGITQSAHRAAIPAECRHHRRRRRS